MASKNKLLWLLIILLLVANTVTLSVLWWGNSKQPPVHSQLLRDFLTEQLQLDSVQRAQYEQLITAHRAATAPLRQQVATLKDSALMLLRQGPVTEAAKQAATANIAAASQQLELVHLNHFEQVRKLCRPAQQEKFDNLLSDIVRMLSMPPPGPKGPRQDGRPGPPPNGPGDRQGPPPEGPPPGNHP